MARRPLTARPGLANMRSMPGRRLALLHDRDVRLLAVARTVSGAGDGMTVGALAFAVLEVTGSAAAVGLVLGATRLPLLLAIPFGGVVADRLERRTILVCADLVRALAMAAAAALLLTGRASVAALVLLVGLAATAQAFWNPAAVALLPTIVEPGRRQQANALLDGARTATALSGMLVGGVLVAATSAGVALAIDAGTFVVSAACLAALRARSGGVAESAARRTLRGDVARGWREVRTRPWLLTCTVHVALLNCFALAGFFALGPVVAERELGGAVAWALVGVGFGLGMLAGGAVAYRVRPRRPLLVACAAVLLAVPELLLLAAAAPLPALAAAAALGGAEASFWMATWTATLQDRVPGEALGRVAALDSAGTLLLAPLGFVVCGALAEVVGTAPVLYAGAAYVVVATAVVVRMPCCGVLRRGGCRSLALAVRQRYRFALLRPLLRT